MHHVLIQKEAVSSHIAHHLSLIRPQKTEQNLKEFAAKDYNWCSVCPKEHMYLCNNTQEVILLVLGGELQETKMT